MHRIAYIVLAHKNPRQVAALLSALATPQATFFLHVDRKSPPSVERDVQRFVDPSVSLVPLRRHRCEWGDFGAVAATLDALEAAAEHGGSDHVVLLSGQDYPVKPVAAIERFLQQSAGASFIDYQRLPHTEWHDSFERYHHWHFRRGGRHLEIPIRRRLPVAGLELYGGSQWWCLAQRDAQSVLDFVAGHPAYRRFFKRTLIPDEVFFHTILLNTADRRQIVNDELHFVKWRDDAASPAILNRDDIPAMVSSPKLFARKFDTAIDPGILQAVDVALRLVEDSQMQTRDVRTRQS